MMLVWRQRAPWAGAFGLPVLVLLALSALTRVAIGLRPDVHLSALQWPAVMLVGAAYDLVFALYFFAPLAFLLLLAPNGLMRHWVGRGLFMALLGGFYFGLLFVAAAEWTFWDEFSARFNFIAVDYLVYTNEVVGNIWQSYPVGKILLGLGVLALLITIATGPRAARALRAPMPWRSRPLAFAGLLLALVLVTLAVQGKQKDVFGQDAANELAGNGPYQFFAAFRANDLSYPKYYQTLPEEEVYSGLRALRLQPAPSGPSSGAAWIDPDAHHLAMRLTPAPSPRRWNVILVSVESLGADFVGAWGDKRGLTPNLDALAAQSLRFDRIYATGNRTVRGLEALSLSLPPTPGLAIVKRPDNGGLITLGSVLRSQGYQSVFVYGGYGYFDNMNAYFAANGYDVADRQAVNASQIHFENIWGIADEDLYDLALREMDRRIAEGRGPVFEHIMTTSNHRPFTYPAGRVDIPSGSGREGAVKYTDWAIGHLLQELRRRPWARDTLLVITADHGANARGTTTIPVDQYRIPLIMLQPDLPPARVAREGSQIDIVPTILGLLRLPVQSRFFGDDLLAPRQAERAFVGNYQALGYLRDGRLVTLLPRRKVLITPSAEAPAPASDPAKRLSDAQLLREAVTWYQGADLAFRKGALRDAP